MFGVSVAAILFTVEGWGPFHWGTLNTNLINLQLFLAGVGLTSLILVGIAADLVLPRTSLILISGWILSSFLIASFVNREVLKDRDRLSAVIADTLERTENRMTQYEDALRSGASLIGASVSVDSGEWKKFAEGLAIRRRYPGIRGIGTILPVPRARAAEFEKRMQALEPGFRIHRVPGVVPPSDHDDLFVITYLEPREDNQGAIGLDVGSEQNRRVGAELARDTGLPTVTRKIVLVQDDQSRPGFLLYLPYYQSPDPPPERRRSEFRGWVYAPFVTEELFKGILGTSEHEVDFAVFDSAEPGGTPIFATREKLEQFERVTPITIGQLPFSIGWRRSPGFLSAHDPTAAWVGFVGAMFSLLMAGFAASLDATRVRAQAIADRQTELLRQGQEKMVAASRLSSLGEMAAGIAHEINNPLAIINLDFELIRMHVKQGAPKTEIEARVGHAEQVVMRIAAIIANLRKFGREAGHDPFEAVPVKGLIADSVSLCGERFRQHEIKLTIGTFDPELKVRARGVQLAQVLVNLLSNAFDAVQGCKDPAIAIVVQDSGAKVKIGVRDNGPGVPDAVRDKIMQPFFTTKEVGKGTGLGLSISRGIMAEHNGSLEYERVGENTVFYFLVPKA